MASHPYAHNTDTPVHPHPQHTWKAMPQHCPRLLNTGPPLLPPLMAASICIPSRSMEPWEYCVTCTAHRGTHACVCTGTRVRYSRLAAVRVQECASATSTSRQAHHVSVSTRSAAGKQNPAGNCHVCVCAVTAASAEGAGHSTAVSGNHTPTRSLCLHPTTHLDAADYPCSH